MGRGFTIVEILISVMIVSVVGLALLQVSSNNTKMLNYIHKKSEITLLPSAIISHADENDHNRKLYMYDLLRKSYPRLDNDDVISILREYEPIYKEEIISTIDLSEEDSENQDDEYGYYDDSSNENPIVITISKISISFENQSTYLYKLSLEGL